MKIPHKKVRKKLPKLTLNAWFFIIWGLNRFISSWVTGFGPHFLYLKRLSGWKRENVKKVTPGIWTNLRKFWA